MARSAAPSRATARKPLAAKPKLSDDEMKAYARKVTEFGEWCAEQGMPLSYHHHMAAVVETEPELDAFMRYSGEGIPLAARCRPSGLCRRRRAARHRQSPPAHQPCACEGRAHGGDRRPRPHEDSPSSMRWRSAPSPCPATARSISAPSCRSSPTMAMRAGSSSRPSRIPRKNPPLRMAQVGHKELMRVMTAAGYTVETQGFPNA